MARRPGYVIARYILQHSPSSTIGEAIHQEISHARVCVIKKKQQLASAEYLDWYFGWDNL